jgi:hypothetical protein
LQEEQVQGRGVDLFARKVLASDAQHTFVVSARISIHTQSVIAFVVAAIISVTKISGAIDTVAAIHRASVYALTEHTGLCGAAHVSILADSAIGQWDIAQPGDLIAARGHARSWCATIDRLSVYANPTGTCFDPVTQHIIRAKGAVGFREVAGSSERIAYIL